MTRDEALKVWLPVIQMGVKTMPECKEALDLAISTMRKYQKIEDIYYHQSGQALENSLRAVIEDGKID